MNLLKENTIADRPALVSPVWMLDIYKVNNLQQPVILAIVQMIDFSRLSSAIFNTIVAIVESEKQRRDGGL